MEYIIPLFSCKSLDLTLAFYQALGFAVTYQQERPYLYAAVTRGEINIHFSRRAKATTCLVYVPEVARYHGEFAAALRLHYGKVPVAGLPRITRFRAGHTRFQLFDPTGNTLLFIDQQEADTDYVYDDNQSSLAAAVENAAFLRDTYADDKAAARVLDLALERHPDAATVDRALALATRAELAVAMDEVARRQAIQAELQRLPLSDQDRERLSTELHAAAALERWITMPD